MKEWELEADRLGGLRGELNAVVDALHRAHPNDLTIYESMGTSIKWADVLHANHDDNYLLATERQCNLGQEPRCDHKGSNRSCRCHSLSFVAQERAVVKVRRRQALH